MPRRITKPLSITIIALVLVFGGIFGWKAIQAYFIKQYFSGFQPPPAAITAAVAGTEEWQPRLAAVGSLVAVQGVDVANEVEGIVEKINFESGGDVQAGDVLVKLDDKADRAELQGLLASRELARKNFTRSEQLIADGFVSKSALDTVRSQLQQAEAQVLNKQTLVAKKTIRAPFSGRLGIRQVNLGQYLAPGTRLVTLQSLHPMYVNFSLPEQDRGLVSVGEVVQVSVDSFPDRTFQARVTAIEARVDPQTRNVAIQATLPNPQRLLQPGMFAKVDVLLPRKQTLVTLPKTAITYSPYGNAVFLIKQDGQDKDGRPVLRAMQQMVQTGETQGDRVAILKGVVPGDQVVTAGQLKLQNGSQVTLSSGMGAP